MNKFLFLIFTLISLPGLSQQTESNPEVNVIYGDHHIFTIETPDGWVNDKQAASTINLVSFFYSKADSSKNSKSYMYAMGYDKDENNKDLNSFIAGDLKTFQKKYPELSYDEIVVGATGGILNATMYSFVNLNDRYKEEVIYMETDSSILVFSFAAFNERDYMNYQPIFDEFMGSFNYRGNNPKPYLDWVKSQN